MFKLPKDVLEIIRTIEKAGFEAYVVGGSVRDALLGISPLDWDMASNAPAETIQSLFPRTVAHGERFGVVRVTLGEVTAEVAAFRIDGNYSDHRRPDQVVYTDSIEEDLKRRDFTVNGMAFHPDRGVLDPFGGQKDLKAKLLRTIGDPVERFTEDPLRILRGIRMAGQLDFDFPMEVFASIQQTATLLDQISMDRRRQEFKKLMVTKNTGKALRMCVSANVFPYIVGDCYPPKGKQENGDFSVLLQNVDQAKPEFVSRMALLLLCFDKKKSLSAIERMLFDKETAKKLTEALTLLTELNFTQDRYDLKRFLYLKGEETYSFLNEVAKQQRDVYGTPGFRIESRYYILDDIRKSKEPIFINQLAVSGADLVEAGIAEGEKVGEMLSMLIDVVHRFPGLNTKPKLLQKAKELRNPLKAKLRNIYFIK